METVCRHPHYGHTKARVVKPRDVVSSVFTELSVCDLWERVSDCSGVGGEGIHQCC